MNLHEGYLFWPTTIERPAHCNPEISPFYDAIIIGGGMSGVLTAKALLNEGLKVALLDKRLPGEGSTAANTGLLQFSNDILLHELIEQIGEAKAVRFYELCLQAVDQLEQIARPLNCDFIRRSSLFYPSSKKDYAKIKAEFEALQKYQFPVTLLNHANLLEFFAMDCEYALLTENDAEINPYKFVILLLEQLKQQGLHVFEKTMLNIIERKGEQFELHTIAGIFHTKNIIYTTGYEALPFGKMKGANVNRSYVAITNQIEQFKPWHQHSLIWETAKPYHYIRTTVDHRIIIGGLDEEKKKPEKKLDKIEDHAIKLMAHLKKLFPNIDAEIEFLYSASFGESVDHLPFIGKHPSKPGHYYLLGYGGNGTVYSMLGSKIIADLLMNRENADAQIVTLNRKFGMLHD